MNISPIETNISLPASGATSAAGSITTDFRQAMLERLKAVGAGESKTDKAQNAAQQFVSSALIMPMLQQMRSSVFKSDFLSGGQGEDAFGPQLDQILSDRIVKRMSTPQEISSSGSATQGMSLVDAVYKRIMRSSEPRNNQSALQSDSSRQKVDVHG